MVEIIYHDGTTEVVPQILLQGIIRTGKVKSYKPVAATKSEAGIKNNYLKRGCLIR